MLDEKCKNCRYWFEILKGETGFTKIGECKRYPTFVEKEEDEYCGEFTPIPGSKYLHE